MYLQVAEQIQPLKVRGDAGRGEVEAAKQAADLRGGSGQVEGWCQGRGMVEAPNRRQT